LQYVRDLVRAYGPHTIAAVIIEPVHSDVVLPHRQEFLRGIRELCDEIGAHLAFDESRMAPGRTGSMFATGLYGVHPDMLILGRGMTAGYAPFGAVLIDREVFDVCRNTLGYGGVPADRFEQIDPAACAAAQAVLEVIESDGLVDKAVEDGAYLRDGLRELANTAVTGTPRGVGMLAAIDLIDPDTGDAASPAFADAVLAEARLRGVLLHAVGSALTFAPSFVCSPADLDQVTETVAESIAGATAARAGVAI
jgi:adenosylmethionine-8-amino-7-oxononanoate aminotransferase